MNSLPNTFEDLLALLKQLQKECTDEEYNTYDAKTLGESVDTLLWQYEQKESTNGDQL